MATLFFQGHASFRIQTSSNVVIYIDPFAGEGYDKEADLVLVTHEHPDHNQIQLVPCKDTTKVLRASDMLVDGNYRTVTECGVKITAVPAQNKNHKITECVGYILEVDGSKVYLAGDTSTTDYMKNMHAMALDYAFLPTDGFFNMDVIEASACARLIGAKHSVPVHMKPGTTFDQATADAFEGPGKLIVKPGETITL